MSAPIHSYIELRQQIHRDLRIQHPEWVDSNGNSPICDMYEQRLAQLLGLKPPASATQTPESSPRLAEAAA
jgi:hypothetical protein